MLHIATAHLGTRWIDVQLAYLRRHLSEPFKVWASTQRVPPADAAKFDYAYEMLGDHAGKLNLLWYLIDREAADDDLVIFCDSDTVPIRDPVPFLRTALAEVILVAVRRFEDGGDPQPHPCFAAARAEQWRDVGCDWGKAYTWQSPLGGATTDVGSNLLFHLESRQLPWLPLHRTNTVDLHPVWFGIYEGLVYHHGAGSRDYPLTRPEVARYRWRYASVPLIRDLKNVPLAYRRRRQMTRNRELSNSVYQQLVADPEFWRQFVPDQEEPAATSA